MDVIVDGERNFRLDGEPEDMISVLGAVLDYLTEQKRAVVGVTIDDRELDPADVREQVEGLNPADVKELVIQSESITALVDTCISELEETAPALPGVCRSLAELFHGENPEEGYEPFQELANIWSTIKTRELLVANAIGFDLESVTVGDSPLPAMHDELNSFLEECAQALQDGDCILLGDLLEYELAPRAEKEAEIVAMLRDRAVTENG